MQNPHQDYEENDLAVATSKHYNGVPASMIFSFQPGTKLRVFVGCFERTVENRARIIEVSVGFCVLFRGDLVHIGVAYTEDHYRIHCFLN